MSALALAATALAVGAATQAALLAQQLPLKRDRLLFASAVPAAAAGVWLISRYGSDMGPGWALILALALPALLLGTFGQLLPFISEETVVLNTASLWWLFGAPDNPWALCLLAAGSALALFCALSRAAHRRWLKTWLYTWNIAAVSWLGWSQFSSGDLEFLTEVYVPAPHWLPALFAGMAFFYLLLHAGALTCLVWSRLETDMAEAREELLAQMRGRVSDAQLHPLRALLLLAAQAAAHGLSLAFGWNWGPAIANLTLALVPPGLLLLDKKRR